MDTRHGLFKLNLESLIATHIITSATRLLVPQSADPKTSLPIMFYNDFDISEDGNTVIFDDSSYKNTRAENRYIMCRCDMFIV